MGDWFSENILDTGRLPLFCFFAAFVLTFAFIRFSVRMIRAQVSWWPGNITPGGLHIHHVVFGTVAMVAGGVAGLAVPVEPVVWRAVCAAVYGIGTALVLDEFALILHLDDVYWAEEGRLSVDAVAIATGVTGLLLLGGAPLLDDLTSLQGQGSVVFVVSLILVLVHQPRPRGGHPDEGQDVDRAGSVSSSRCCSSSGPSGSPGPGRCGPGSATKHGMATQVGPTSWPRRSAGRSGTANRSSG